MKVAAVALALLLGGAAVVIPQAPQQSAGADDKQYTLIPYVLGRNAESYEKTCGTFYLSEVLGKGNELIGFRFVREGKTEDVVVRAIVLSVMKREDIDSPTAEEVSTDDGGHFVLRMKSNDYAAEKGCLVGVPQMK